MVEAVATAASLRLRLRGFLCIFGDWLLSQRQGPTRVGVHTHTGDGFNGDGAGDEAQAVVHADVQRGRPVRRSA